MNSQLIPCCKLGNLLQTLILKLFNNENYYFNYNQIFIMNPTFTRENRQQQIIYIFNQIKRAPEPDKQKYANQLVTLFTKNQDNAEFIIAKIFKYISESIESQDKKVGLIAISAIAEVLQDNQKTAIINKFHSPIFKLFEINTDQNLLERVANAYSNIIKMGGNKNDTAIENNINSALQSIKSVAAKQIRKIGGLMALRILLIESPYTTFKKLFQKQGGGSDRENYLLINSISRSKNLRIRVQYLKFFEQFVKHIALRRDLNFQHNYFNKFFGELMSTKAVTTQQNIHVCLEAIRILLLYAENVFHEQTLEESLQYIKSRKSGNKNPIVQKSLIAIIPVVSISKKSPVLTTRKDIFSQFMRYLKVISGQDKDEAYKSIFTLIENLKQNMIDVNIVYELKEIIMNILIQLKERINSNNFLQKKDTIIIKCIHSIVLKLKRKRIQQVFKLQQIDQLVSYILFHGPHQESIKLLTEISKQEIFQLTDRIQRKLIAILSKVLTTNYKKLNRDDTQLESFKNQLKEIQKRQKTHLQTEINKIDAIRSFSIFKFRDQYRDIIGTFVRDKIVKYYLDWVLPQTRKVAVEAAFLLYAKKGKKVAGNQMVEILSKIIRVGMCDIDEQVRKVVFICLSKNLNTYEGFGEFLNVQSHFLKLFVCITDRNIFIQNTTLQILCKLSKENPSEIVPFLKKTLYQYLFNLSIMDCNNFNQKKNLFKFLRCIIKHGTKIIESHSASICQLIIKYLQDRQHSHYLSEALFKTFTYLTEHLSFSTLPYIKIMSKFQIEAMQDKLNHRKRSIAVKSFISVIRNCGYVIVPYCKFPNLLPTIVYLLKSEMDTQGREELLKILGGLGALDKLKYKIMVNRYEQQGDRGIQNFMTETKEISYYLKNQRQAIERESKENPINELKHYYQDLIILGGISNKKQVSLAQPLHQYKIIPLKKKKQQFSVTRDIHELTINALLTILQDSSLSKKHSLTIEALSKIVDILGSSIEKHLKHLLPKLLHLSHNNYNVMKVVYIITQNCYSGLGEYVEEVLKVVVKNTMNQLVQISLNILETFAHKFRPYLRHCLESIIHMANKIIRSQSAKKSIGQKIFRILKYLQQLLDPHIHLILPFFCETFLYTPQSMTEQFLELLIIFAQKCSSTVQYLSLITQNLVGLLKNCGKKQSTLTLRSKIINCFVSFIVIYKDLFIIYLPLIHKTVQNGPDNGLYNKCIKFLQNRNSAEQIQNEFTPQELICILGDTKSQFPQKTQPQKYVKKPEGLQNLITQFDPNQKNQIDEDWNQWLRKTSQQLLKKSPNLILKACSSLAQQYHQLANQLYNVAFNQIWLILQSEQKSKMIEHLKRVLNSSPLPPLNIRQTILNLAEFMSRQNFFSEFQPKYLAETAKQAFAYAKTLYFREQLFQLNPERQMQVLIQIYTLLGQPQSAAGLLKIAERLKIKTKVSWLQKLHRFQQARDQYKKTNHIDNVPIIRCFNEIGDWKLVLESCNKLIGPQNKKNVADLAVSASINLCKWDNAKVWLNDVDSKNENKSYWQAMINIREGDYDQAEKNIKNTRNILYNKISQLLTFSSNHSQQSLIRLQQLFQLEQIIQLKKFERFIKQTQSRKKQENKQLNKSFDVKLTKLREVWNDRLVGCSRNLQVWQKILSVRSLLFSKQQYIDYWIDYCKLAIKEGKNQTCRRTLEAIKSQINIIKKHPKMTEIQLLEMELKFRCNLINQEQVIYRIQHFLKEHPQIERNTKAKMYYKCAIWAKEKYEEMTMQKAQRVIDLIKNCTEQNPQLVKGWHLLGIMHVQALLNKRAKSDINYASIALTAFIQSLSLGTSHHKYFLQDCLKLMTLIFQYSEDPSINQAFLKNYKRVSPSGWIDVVPQIIVRLYNKNKKSVNLINILNNLLLYIGEQHPQALIYPLIFATKSKSKERRQPALQILRQIEKKHLILCKEAESISTQLGRAAIKLKEFWHDGIEGAWKTFEQNKNVIQVVNILTQLHEHNKIRQKSNSQYAFQQQFGLQLNQAYEWLQRYKKTNDAICFSQAFQIYFTVYKRIKDSFENLKKVYLKNVAPILLSTNDCKLSIPGLYSPNKPTVRIQGFANQLTVLQSKQRPRKLTIYGSDGKQYNFLLKGREDLRLDERVMQLLTLVNKLLGLSRSTLKKDLFITKYSIIPLSVNTGLIGWVQQCDTLNELIKQYRTQHKIRPNVQKELYQKFCDQYAQLPLMNKVQIFRHVLQSTQGLDLAKVLWLKSPNCQVWIERRTCYIRSLATMSMVGYILGLGDRHPSNIMIQRQSGKIVHIDFGDCFEVAMLRDKFPEKVPFRLTRMLQKAMQVCGIDGNYKATCETVMSVLRNNKQSLLIVLEAFAYDPIISWKLIVQNNHKHQNKIVSQEKRIQNAYPFPDDKKQQEQITNTLIQAGLSYLAQNKQGKEKLEADEQKKIQLTPGRYFKTDNQPPQFINQKAIKALQRIKKKLNGRDFDDDKTVPKQVQRLIKQATSYENICQSWLGWCPFW